MRSMLARTAAVIAFGAASFTSHGALAESVLRHVPQADLKVLDPVTNTAFITSSLPSWCTTSCSPSMRTTNRIHRW